VLCGLRRNRHRPKSADHAQLLAEHDYIARYEAVAGDTAGFYSELLTEMGARSGDRLLDVGCSIGVGLKVASARGLHADGIEPDVAARRIAEKSGFQTWNSVDDLPAGALYDCFVMNHVLEHVVDPDKTLRQLRSHAAPGARLFIGVPSGAAAWARVQRDRWCFLALDEHVWYFDPKTLRSTATNAGWAVKTCRTSSRRYPGGPVGAAKNLALAVADAIGLGETVNLVGVFPSINR
jgi:2-polyprenyl-3-methyl-5-hydroxy-6-metoxy-1,4-benzoquinol methylase